MSEQAKLAVDEHLKLLIQMNAVRKTFHQSHNYYNNVFPIIKPNKVRLIFNEAKINKFIDNTPFHMESMQSILDMICKENYFCSLDIVHAFLNIALHPSNYKFMCFWWRDEVYFYTTTAFGLCLIPRLYSKLNCVITTCLRKQGICIMSYLTIHSAKLEAKFEIATVVHTYLEFGLLPHIDKSVFKPTQIIEHLGFLINSKNMTISITDL